jgi:glycosyltransferase involved in cell wall biosynthesis
VAAMKIVVIYVADSIDLILTKSNAWYIRHYEVYFDKVYMVYLRGNRREPIVQGRTSLVCLGTGRSKFDFLLAPVHLYKYARQIRPTAYVTSDQIWSWWISWMVQLFLGAKIYLMPQFMPEQIYKSSKRSVSMIFPIWLERILIWLSFFFADHMLTGSCFGNVVQWLRSLPVTRSKTIVAGTLPEALPPPAFLKRMESLDGTTASTRGSLETSFKLVYVGRLQHQKLVDDLVRMMSLITAQKDISRTVELTLIGDGPERAALEKLVDELGVRPFVKFAGQLQNEELPDYLLRSNVYVSPLTGMSLREAAYCGLPVVAYDMDWIQGLLKHEETALLVAPGDHQEMGRQVLRLMQDDALCRRLSRNIKELAEQLWSSAGVHESLRQVFEAAHQTQPA